MKHYIALIHKEPGSDYGVSFPDFPGCVTAGEDLDEARAMAAEALDLHIEGMREAGDVIPEPSRLEAIMADPANRSGVAALIPSTPAERIVRVNISVPASLLGEIDEYVAAHGLTRSGLLLEATATYIREPEGASGVSEPASKFKHKRRGSLRPARKMRLY